MFTGAEWIEAARGAGVDAVALDGLVALDDDLDAGARIHRRAAQMAVLNMPALRDLAPELVVSDVITAGGGMAAELLAIPWIELSPHPLYLPSKGLPPIGSGLAPGTGIGGRLRDATMRALTARSWRAGLRERAAARVEIGLPARDPGPLRTADRHAARAGGAASGLARRGRRGGPVALRTDRSGAGDPGGLGAGGGRRAFDRVDRNRWAWPNVALDCLIPGKTLPVGSRLVVSRLGGADLPVPPWAVVGLGRQAELLRHADLVICGGGHGMVAKTLLAGVPLVVVPGGGDQWEMANRVVRQGSARLIRPLTADALVAAVNEVLSSTGCREAAQACRRQRRRGRRSGAGVPRSAGAGRVTGPR